MDGVEVECLRLAGRQHGVLSREQVEACGFSSRRIELRLASGAWRRLFPGVFRVEGAPETWRQKLKAASLWAGEHYALSHGTAAALQGFNEFRGVQLVHLTSLRHLRAKGVTVHQTEFLDRSQLSSLECFRVTNVPRTLLDLSVELPPPDIKSMFDEAMRRRWVTLERMESFLERSSSRPGVMLLRALTNEYAGGDGPTESELESRVLRLITSAGLPRPRKQKVVRAGRRLRRLDFSFEGTPVVIEADGYAWHASLDAFERDRERRNALTLRGYAVLQWTWRGLTERPGELLEELNELLARFTRRAA